MKVYLALYNYNTEEIACYKTLSVHESMVGAEKAIESHKQKVKTLYEQNYKEVAEMLPFDYFRDWKVSELEILP